MKGAIAGMNVRSAIGITTIATALACCLLLLVSATAHAQGPGALKGKVIMEKGSEPLPFANLVILGTNKGTTSGLDGTYEITGLPTGTHTVKVSYLGYSTQEKQFQVTGAQPVTLEFVMVEEVVATMDEVKIVAERELINLKDSGTNYDIGKEDLERLPVDELQDAIGLKAGVVEQGGNLHFRGGRAGEVQYQIDGIPINDPLGGGSVDIATVSVSESEVLLGGMDAEYGNAQSGVVNISTQEGGDTFAGEVQYQTDDFGAPDKTFNNFDRVSLGLGGPTPIKRLNYYVSLQGTWSDTYLSTRERRERHQVLDFITVGPRQSNTVDVQAKLSWRPGPAYKLTGEMLNKDRQWDNYSHTFSQVGFVETRVDTIADTGDIVTRYGEFSERQEGPNWVYYNAAEHTPNNDENFRLFKTVWTHNLSEGTFYEVKLSHSSQQVTSAVNDQLPWEYQARYPDQWRDRINFDTHPYFATNGDVSNWSERTTKVWTLKSDWTSQFGPHKMKTGLEFRYNDLALFQVQFPNRTGPDGQIGLLRSQYHYYNPEGSFYVQDRWEHEGMVINGGLRYDAFSVGNQLDASEVETRVRSQWSPRLGIAYPISDRDVFSFHYGRFSQIPDRRFIFEDRGGAVQTRGNPNLENETTVSYQAALQHMFTPDVFGQFTVYFKDIFGLLTIDQISSGDSPNLVNQYVNKDYASSRGFEVSITKRFTKNFAGDLSYAYGVATGVASDPNIQERVEFLFLPISEQPLDWDQRHTFSASGTVAEPGNWSVNFIWSYGSGFPYTPRERSEREADPLKTNSLRLPGTSTLTLQAEKHYRVWGQQLKLFLRGNNILDSKNIVNLSPAHFPQPPQAGLFDYDIFYTETGRAGGAFLGDDLNGDGIQDWVPVNDPRVFAEGRNIRIGLGLKF